MSIRFSRTWTGGVATVVCAIALGGAARATQEVIGDEPPNANAAVVPLLEDLNSEDRTARMAAIMAMHSASTGPLNLAAQA